MYKFIKSKLKKIIDPNYTECYTAYIKRCLICVEYKISVNAKSHRDAYFKLNEYERQHLVYIDNGYQKKTKNEILNKKTLLKFG